MILRSLAGLAGVAILAASAYATIEHTSADAAQQALIWAMTSGVAAGALVVVHAKGAARWVVLALLACGELYGGVASFERIIESREAKAVAGRAALIDRGTTAEDIRKAEVKLERARADASSKAALRDCRSNCRQLLQDAINAATDDLDAARAKYASIGVPPPVDVMEHTTGVAAWKISLGLAMMLALATNGLGAALVGVAAHGRVRTARPAPAPVELDFRPRIIVSDEAGPEVTDRPNPGPGRTVKRQALSELLALLTAGQTIPSQDSLALRWNRPKQTVSDWLREWRRIGVVPSETRIGRCKAMIPA